MAMLSIFNRFFRAATDTCHTVCTMIDPKTLMKNLTVGYQQMVEIAKAIQQDAKILIMDEPSAPLTSAEVESMFRVVERLRKEGVSIIYISILLLPCF